MKIRYAKNWRELEKILSDLTISPSPLKYEWKNGKLFRIKFCNLGDWKKLRKVELKEMKRKIK